MRNKKQPLEPIEWVSDNMIRTKRNGKSVGKQERIEFEDEEYEVVVVDTTDEIAIVEVLEKIQNDGIEIFDKGLNAYL